MPKDNSKQKGQEEEKHVLNKLLNTHNTIRLVRSFSVPIAKMPVLRTFCEIARREAGSRGFSEVIINAMEEYVRNHEEGNPQLKLTPYIDEKVPSPVLVLCLYLDGAGSNGKVHCRKAGMWIKGLRCYGCDNNRLRKNR